MDEGLLLLAALLLALVAHVAVTVAAPITLAAVALIVLSIDPSVAAVAAVSAAVLAGKEGFAFAQGELRVPLGSYVAWIIASGAWTLAVLGAGIALGFGPLFVGLVLVALIPASRVVANVGRRRESVRAAAADAKTAAWRRRERRQYQSEHSTTPRRTRDSRLIRRESDRGRARRSSRD